MQSSSLSYAILGVRREYNIATEASNFKCDDKSNERGQRAQQFKSCLVDDDTARNALPMTEHWQGSQSPSCDDSAMTYNI